MIGETNPVEKMITDTVEFFANYSVDGEKIKWLGDGTTSKKIIEILLQEKNK